MASRPGVLCRGLPYQADVEDVRQFFKSLDIPERNIEVMVCADGLGSGVAYVALRDEEEVKRALLMDRNHIGTRYIDVMRADDGRVDQVRSALASGASRNEVHRMSAGEPLRRTQDQPPMRDRSPIRLGPRIMNSRTRCGYFRGLPDGCMYKDIRQFFKGILIPKNSIHLIRDSSNRFRGDGYIEFANSEELKKALKLDGETMEGSVIRIDPCTEEEMLDMMGYTERRGRSPASHDIYYQGYGGYGSREGGYNRSREPPAPAVGYYNEPPLYRGGWSSYEEDKGRHGGYGRYLPRSSNPYSRGFEEDDRKHLDLRQAREPPMRSYGDQRRYEPPPMVSYPQPPASIPQERKVLRVHGLPDAASAADVMAFFRDYGVQYEDVRLQCHDDGRPNGKAFVTFPTERLAQTAYRNLNHQYIRGIPVELLIV